MKIINQTKGKVITSECKRARSFQDKFLGLLKKSNPRSILLKTRFGVHTLFLEKPIDVLVLDTDFNAVKLVQSLKPNRLYFWNPRYCYVLELPQFTIRNTNTEVGDVLEVTLA